MLSGGGDRDDGVEQGGRLPMKMEIGCPAELTKLEQARFWEGRRQAYLTFLNESDDAITGLSATITLLDEKGAALEARRVSFTVAEAEPGEAFTCHLALDGYPEFAGAEVTLEQVQFRTVEPWAINPARMIDCTPPPLPEGAERVALVALAGMDAVCFPQRRGSLWVCVCGRFNRWRWSACRRCGRPRDDVLALFAPDAVVEAYREHVEEVRAEDRERLRQRAEAERAEKARAKTEAQGKRAGARKRKRLTAFALLLALSGLLLLGLFRLLTHRPYEGDGETVTLETTARPPVDYLEPIG